MVTEPNAHRPSIRRWSLHGDEKYTYESVGTNNVHCTLVSGEGEGEHKHKVGQ